MWLLNKIRRLFCDHEYEREVIKGGYIVEDGWLRHPVQYRCRKCGKIRKKMCYDLFD